MSKEYECGTIVASHNPVTGDIEWKTLYCNDFRNCDVCHNRRVMEYRSKLLSALERHRRSFLNYIVLTAKESHVFVRKTDAENYLRLPFGKNRVAFLYTETGYDNLEDSMELSVEQLGDHEVVGRLCIPAKGRRVSGKLLKKESEEDEEKGDFLLHIPNFAIYGSKETVKECWAKTMAQTHHWDLDLDNADFIISQRMKVFKGHLESAGISISGQINTRRWVDSSKLVSFNLSAIKDQTLYSKINYYCNYLEPLPQPSPFLAGVWSSSPKEPAPT